MSPRIERVNVLLQQEISYLLQREVNDPRLQSFITVTEVVTAPDLKNAQVYVSIMGSAEEKREAMQALRSAAGFLRRALASRVDMRFIPFLSFRNDDSIERGARLLESIHKLAAPGI